MVSILFEKLKQDPQRFEFHRYILIAAYNLWQFHKNAGYPDHGNIPHPSESERFAYVLEGNMIYLFIGLPFLISIHYFLDYQAIFLHPQYSRC